MIKIYICIISSFKDKSRKKDKINHKINSKNKI